MSTDTSRSYLYTPKSEPYMYATVPERLHLLASEDPDRDAFVFYNLKKERECLSRKQLLDQSTNAAKHFIQSGVKKGTPVAFCMNNSLEMLVAVFGVTIAGGVPFYISPNMKDGSDLIDMMRSLKGEMLVIDTTGSDDNWTMLENIWSEKSKTSEKVPSLNLILYNSTNTITSSCDIRRSLKTFIDEIIEDEVQFPYLQPEDHLAYFCTSGSTGEPKKVTYSHFGIMNWTRSSNKVLKISNNSRMFCDRTFSWVLGYPRTYFTEGSTRVFVDMRISVARAHVDFLCDIIAIENCDVVFLPGYIATDLLRFPDLVQKFKNVQTIFLGGERTKSVFYEALCGKYCSTFVGYYGTTESGGAMAYTNECGKFEDGMIGKPLEGMEVKLVDTSGVVVPVGEQGEICLRSVWRFVSYQDSEEQFREVVDHDNWFHTRDIGHLGQDGNVIMHGRKKEWISSGSVKFFPWSIENNLSKIPGADQVFAVGVPDPRLLQVVCACVLPKPGVTLTVEDVKKFCDETFIDVSTAVGISSKPRYYVIMKEVPLTRTGKIDRRMVSIRAREQLGL